MIYQVVLSTTYWIDTEDWPSVEDESDAIDLAFEYLEDGLSEGLPLGEMFAYTVEEKS